MKRWRPRYSDRTEVQLYLAHEHIMAELRKHGIDGLREDMKPEEAPRKMHKARLNVSLTEGEEKRIDDVARRLQVTRGAAVSLLLRCYLATRTDDELDRDFERCLRI